MSNIEEYANIEKLEGPESFASWRFELKIMLNASNILEALSYKDGDKDSDHARKDAKAQKAIIMSISKKNKQLVMSCKSAAEMYKKLTSIYEGDNDRLKDNLLAQYFGFRIKNIAKGIAELENIVTQLNGLGHEIKDEELTQRILSALPELYNSFAVSWDSTPKEERTSTNLIARLMKEVGKASSSKTEETNVAFTAARTAQFRKCDVKCYECGVIGHFARNCSTKKDDIRCKICKKTNHSSEDCYFRKNKNWNTPKTSESSNYSKKCQRSKNTYTDKAAFFTCVDNDDAKNTTDYTIWTIDSGSSSHMCNDDTYLVNAMKIHSEITIAKDGIKMAAVKKGDISFVNCTLKNVLYVPELSTNLLSVNKIIEAGGQATFQQNKVEIKCGDLILHGHKNESNLFEVKLIPDPKNSALVVEEDYTAEWHRKLGHLGHNLPIKLKKCSEGMEKLKLPDDKQFCKVCAQSKQTRLPFNNNRKKAERPLEILHFDLCGPIQETWDNKSYFLAVLDDYTHYSVVALLHHKSELARELKSIVAEFEAKWNTKVHMMRCDNAGENSSRELREWAKEKGIMFDFSPPYVPELNGKSE